MEVARDYSILYFVRDKGEYREVIICRTDNTYRVVAMTGGIGKRHENANEYVKSIINKGWRRCSLTEMLWAKYKEEN